jgi:uncharacterized protein
MIKYIISIFLFSAVISLDSNAQSVSEINLMRQINPVIKKTKLKDKYEKVQQNKNELQFIFSGMFLVYKDFFSSQDSKTCTFHPSCSEYGLLAVKKFGIIKGVFSGFDRMTRCHLFEKDNYPMHPEYNLLHDPL